MAVHQLIALPPYSRGMSSDDICGSKHYALTHAIAETVRRRGAEGLLIPSCTKFRGGNLIIFPDLVRPESVIRVVDTEDPDLFVDWNNLS